jgi:foldase protein PrsA
MLKEDSVRRHIVLLLAVFLVFSVGCQKKPAAVVNGAKISQKALKWHLNERIKGHEARGTVINEPDLRDAVLDQLISEKLLSQGATKQGITVTNENVSAEMDRIRQRMGQEAFTKSLRDSSLSISEFKDIVREKLVVRAFGLSLASDEATTDEDIKEFYQTNPTPFLVPESVNLRFIQTATKGHADELIEELNAGKVDFDTMADKLSEKKQATVSAYSWANPNFFRPEIAKALKEIKEGAYGGPYVAAQGYYIFRVKEREHERAKTLDEASAEIKAMLINKKRQAMLTHWIAETKKTAKIVRN